ncbi:hypothetical protein ACFHYQ_15870 [Sphaerimonospora cavernae]|uniref:Uncharacterized protein n=1 Tax=Sphaerimonospora cavernae TaxID=1740611 RepID=A0ABV6U8S6_9ACTN
MMRLHFEAADLRRITLAPAPDPLMEIVLNIRLRLAVCPIRQPGVGPGPG